MNTVATNLERIIAEKGYKKKVVAQRAGITAQNLSDMLKGRKIIRADMIPAFCMAMQVEPNEFYKPIQKGEQP